MFSDPLAIPPADSISTTTPGSPKEFRKIKATADFNEYRYNSTDSQFRTESTLRIANYANGSANKRRVVFSILHERSTVDGLTDFEPVTITASFSYVEDELVADQLHELFRDLVYLISNDDDQGLLTRALYGEK